MPPLNWIPLAVSAFLTAILALGAHLLYMAYVVEPGHVKALAEQKTALETSCQEAKKITEGVSDAFAKSSTDLADRLDLNLLRPTTCILVPAPGPAGRDHAAAAATKLSQPHGIPAATFYRFAASAEKTRLQLIGCQDFIKKTWALNGQ